jgi:hypothetical protein
MKASPAQTNFTSGELSPRMRGRVDVKKFLNGVEKLQNFNVHPQGGISRRPGLRHIKPTKIPGKQVLLVPFEFSDESSYMLEFGEGYIHFLKDRKPLLETRDRAISGTNTCVESFDNIDNVNRMSLTASIDDLPGWGDIDFWYAPSDNGEISIADNGSGLIRITTTIPHTLRTGVKIWLRTDQLTALGNIAHDDMEFTITRIDSYSFDLQGSAFSQPAVDNHTAFFTHGLLPGDWFYIRGAANYSELTEQWHRVHSVEFAYQWTLANVPFRDIGNPAAEEALTIPIEVATDYDEDDLEDLYFAQTADVLYIFHPDYPVAKLTRQSNEGYRSDWLLADVNFIDGPYLPLNSMAPTKDSTTPANGSIALDVYLEVSAYAHTAVVKSATDFTDATDDNGTSYLEFRDRDQWRLALVTLGGISGADLRSANVSIIDNTMLYMDETVKLKNKGGRKQTYYTPGSGTNSAGVPWTSVVGRVDSNNSITSTAAAGNLTSQFSNTFGIADVGKFIRFGTTANPPVFHWALIDGLSGTTGTTARHDAAVDMVNNQSTGKFIITAETRTCTVTAYKDNAVYALFASTDVGRLIRLGYGGRWTWGKITAFTSTSVVSVTLYDDMPRDPHNALNIAGNQNAATPTTGITYDWRLGAWSDTTGYPSTAEFHEQRLVAGKTATEPHGLWGSRPNSFEDMSPTEPDSTVTDENAITYTIVARKVSPIRWLSSGPTLLIGGLGYEWQLRAASSIAEPISPTNISITPQSPNGSRRTVRPQRVGPATIFVDRAGRKVREMTYDFQLDAFTARDISVMAEHILRENSKCVYSEFQKNPIPVYWLVLGNGVLAGMTYEKEQDIIAWHRHVAGGSGAFESIGVIPTDDGDVDDVYVVCKRTINGIEVRHIEVQEDEFEPTSDADIIDMPYYDALCEANVDFATVIDGFEHLIGESVYALADGEEVGPLVVDAEGSITLTTAAEKVLGGYRYSSLLKTLPPEAGAMLGSAQTKTKRVNKVGVRVINSISLQHCSDNSTWVPKVLGPGSSTFYTGDDVFTLSQAYGSEGTFYIKEDRNRPLSILLLSPQLNTMEEGG